MGRPAYTISGEILEQLGRNLVEECLPEGLAMRALQIPGDDQMATLTGMNGMQGYNQFEQGQTLDQVRPKVEALRGLGI